MDTEYKFASIHRRATVMAAALMAFAGVAATTAWGWDQMTLHSATFVDGSVLPLSMINTVPNSNGQNTCTASGANGGNESPQLSWHDAPPGTQSFAVIVYDATAQFTHWQMYNIPADRAWLPQNAGVPGSMYGAQNGNDYFQANYDGPCPPTTLHPTTHRYEFTVYALDTLLPVVQVFGNFDPAGPEGLYRELIRASQQKHVLATATLVGYFSAVATD